MLRRYVGRISLSRLKTYPMSLGRVFGSTAPYVSAWLVANSGNPIAPAWYLALVALAGLGTALVGLRPLVRA